MFRSRNIAPNVEALQAIKLLHPETIYTPSGLPIHVLRNIPNEIFHVQIELEGGKFHQKKPLINAFSSDLLFSGTSDYTQFELQEKLDLQGAFIQMEATLSSTVLNVYGLLSCFEQVFGLVNHVLTQASYPEKEFELHVKAAKQRHLVNMEKNSYVARREFLATLFPDNLIGQVANEQDFDAATKWDCFNFYSDFYANNVRQIHVVGAVSDHHIQVLETVFDKRYKQSYVLLMQPIIPEAKQLYIEKPNAVQSTIRIGRMMFTPKHPDYFEFDILETILGGYFGSRLMQNLREEKGYTYGVSSGITSYEHTGYLSISTEVGKQHKDAAMDAIRYEIERLREELISESELSLAKAYIQGQVLKSTDGAFAQMNQFLFAKRFDLQEDNLNQFLQTLSSIKPERLRDLAQMYLDWSAMTKIVVG